jgi:hypothetical protein
MLVAAAFWRPDVAPGNVVEVLENRNSRDTSWAGHSPAISV